ncbi:MAG: DUF1800 domain-containing protein, partial [Chitinophagaceae bacterium]|nr:DUF1800 domain-containing protein [Rubrivivax sp.]
MQDSDSDSADATLARATGLAAVALLAACGGGERGDPATAFADPASALSQPELLLGSTTSGTARRLAASDYRVPTTDELFAFAERQYAQFFPSVQANQVWDGIVYRYYPSTGNY